MTLLRFVKASKHSTERERLLYITAVQELKLHAAKYDARLMITEPELDIEGFDFVISSEFESLYVQSKGTLSESGARRWHIRAALLKPSFYNRDLIPPLDGAYELGWQTGANGGVLLHVIDQDAAAEDRFEVKYRYLDIFWLMGVAWGLTGRRVSDRVRALELLRAIRDSDDQQRIILKYSDFARLKSLSVLAMLRFHIGHMSNWTGVFRRSLDELPKNLHDLSEIKKKSELFVLWQVIRELLD